MGKKILEYKDRKFNEITELKAKKKHVSLETCFLKNKLKLIL